MTAPPRIAGLVLAAGDSRRFGATPKQLALLDGRPLLEHALAAMAAAPALDRVAVTLGAHAQEIVAAVDLHGAAPLLVEEWAEGQAASLRAGIAALAPHADAVLVVLGDQPRVPPAAIAEVIAAWVANPAAAAVRATFGGNPGHPVLLTRQLFPAVAALRGDGGARSLFAAVAVHDVECGAGTVQDVDTPADLEGPGRFRSPS